MLFLIQRVLFIFGIKLREVIVHVKTNKFSCSIPTLNIFTVFNNKHCENMIFDNHSFKTEICIKRLIHLLRSLQSEKKPYESKIHYSWVIKRKVQLQCIEVT